MMVETSGRGRLTGRQACAVESAARRFAEVVISHKYQGDSDGRGKQTASTMLTAIMSGGVGISGRELSTQLINSLEQANQRFS